MLSIKAVDLTKRFGNVVALDNLNFDIEGDVVAIVGPNGSGKSTLLSIIAGLRYPTKGKLLLNNIEPYKRREEVLSKITFSFEKPRFNIGVRVCDVLDTALGICRDHGMLMDMARSLGITRLGSRRLHELSSGQSQLLSLIIALFCDKSSIAILDEPLAHLDIRHQGIFLNAMSSRGNIIFTTHVLEEAEVVADKIVILDSGRVRWVGSVEDMYMDGLFEVIVSRRGLGILRRRLDGAIVADFGTHILVKDVDEDALGKMVNEGVIVGYRRAGLRARLYGEV